MFFNLNPSGPGPRPRRAPSPAPKGLRDGPRVRRLQTLRSRAGTAPVTLMRNRLNRAGKEGRAGPGGRSSAVAEADPLPSLPSSLWPALGTPQPPGTPVTCGAAPAPSPGLQRCRGGEKRPGGRGEKNVQRPSGEVAWFDSPLPPLVGLLRLHFPSSFISEIKEGETHGEGKRGTP